MTNADALDYAVHAAVCAHAEGKSETYIEPATLVLAIIALADGLRPRHAQCASFSFIEHRNVPALRLGEVVVTCAL